MKKFLLPLLCILALESVAQEIPREFELLTDSVIEAAPRTYYELDRSMRPFRRDTILMPYFISKAGEADFQDGLAYAYNQMGTRYRNISQYDRAIAFHEKGLAAAETAGNVEFRIFSLNMLGVVYRRQDAIKTALDYNQEALELAEQFENPTEGIKRSINVSLNSIGNIYEALKQYDRAITHYKKSLQLEGELGNKTGLAVNHQNIGECLEAQGKYEEALEHYQTSLQYDEELDSDRGRAICYNSIAQIYIKQDKIDEAYEILKTNLPAAVATNDQHISATAFINTGWVLLKLRRFAEAESYLKEGVAISEANKFLRNSARSYALLSELEQARGRPDKALAYYKESKAFDEIVNNDVNLSYVNDVIIRYDTEKKNSQIRVLAQENELVKLRLRRNQNTFLISALILALLALVLYIIYRQYQIRSERKLISLEQSMLRSQMNPHFLFNSLNSIKHYIINNEQKNAVHYLNKFSKLVRKILDASSVRETKLAEELETVELYMNIENIRFSEEIDFTIEIEDGIDPHLVKIPSLIIQPFLENAIWHGLSSKDGEKKLQIAISKPQKGFIQISITDNGVGRAAAAELEKSKVLKRKSVGIDITRERLANFSKDFQNSSDIEIIDLTDKNGKAAGTQVILHIPTI